MWTLEFQRVWWFYPHWPLHFSIHPFLYSETQQFKSRLSLNNIYETIYLSCRSLHIFLVRTNTQLLFYSHLQTFSRKSCNLLWFFWFLMIHSLIPINDCHVLEESSFLFRHKNSLHLQAFYSSLCSDCKLTPQGKGSMKIC